MCCLTKRFYAVSDVRHSLEGCSLDWARTDFLKYFQKGTWSGCLSGLLEQARAQEAQWAWIPATGGLGSRLAGEG